MRRCRATWEVVGMEGSNESGRDGRVVISWPLTARWRLVASQQMTCLSVCVSVTERGDVMCVCIDCG